MKKDGEVASAETLRDGSGPQQPRAEDLPTVDRAHYDVAGELARGGMGRIVEALDKRLDRVVAVKEVLGRDAVAMARFAREVRITAKLQHPGIVSIYEAGRWDSGEPFYAMRLVHGEPLHTVVGRAVKLPDRLALLPKLLAVAEAVAYAHAQRIIHRDLKPHNVLVGDYGETVVIDWGLAKHLDDNTVETLPGEQPRRAIDGPADSITVFGAVMGTPAYMPVEQATGQAVDERADVYAIGAMIYQLLGHRPPYLGATGDKVLDALVAGPPAPLARIVPDAPADVVAIVERAMARNPADRYRTAKELAEDLGRYLTGQLVQSHAYTTGELVRRWLRRHRGAVAVAGVATVALGVVAVGSYIKVVAEKTEATVQRANAEAALGEAQRTEAQMLLDRAREMVVAGAPARAAPLLAHALELAPLTGSDDGAQRLLADAVEGQVAAALPALAWTKRIARPERLAVDAAGALVEPADAVALSAVAHPPSDASVVADVAGRVVAVATPDGVALWDVAAGKRRAAVKGCGADDDEALELTFVTAGGTVAGVCRALDGGASRLAVWAHGGVLVVGDIALGRLHGAVASDDGKVVAAIEDGVDAPRLMRDNVAIALAALPGATSVAIDAVGRRVAAGTSNGFVQVWDAATGRELAVTDAGEPVVGVAFSPDGGLVVAAGKRGDAVAWATAGLLGATPVAELPGTVAAVRVDDAGARWAVADGSGTIGVYGVHGKVAALTAPNGATFDPGIALGGEASAVAAIAHRGDPNRGGSALLVFAGAGSSGSGGQHDVALRDAFPVGATWSDDDGFLFAGEQIVDAAAARVVGDQGSGSIWGCTTARADRAVCFVDRDPARGGRATTVQAFAVPAGVAIASAAAIPTPATAFAFAGDVMLVGGCAGELDVVDVVTGQARAPVRLDQGACVTDMETSESGLGAIALASRRVAVWDLADGHVLGTIALDRPVEAFALSTRGFLAIATGDGRIGIWDARSRVQLASSVVEDGVVRGLRVQFVSDEELVATTEHRVWRVRWTQWPAEVPDRSWTRRMTPIMTGPSTH